MGSNRINKLKKRNILRNEWKQMVSTRVPNPPSIPSNKNAFGYEEVEGI